MEKPKTKDCIKCKWNKECVNVNAFKDGDCLQYEIKRNNRR